MIGPPTGVDPRKATDHSDITRPRISGAASSWSMVLPSARNVIDAAPTATRAASSAPRPGATAEARMTAPKTTDDQPRVESRPARRPAVHNPPATAPAPMTDDMVAYRPESPWKVKRASSGRLTWNS